MNFLTIKGLRFLKKSKSLYIKKSIEYLVLIPVLERLSRLGSDNMPNIFGFVRAIRSRDPRHTAPPFVVEIYSPGAKPGKRTKRFHLEEVCDNRELVLVSVLRDALIHSLPVELGCDKDGRIDHVEIRTTTYYEEWKGETITGGVKMISVDESVLGQAKWVNSDLATVVISSGFDTTLYLILQRAERETKMAQLSLLRHAYENDSDVTVKYQEHPLGGGATAKVIVGVRLGPAPSMDILRGIVTIGNIWKGEEKKKYVHEPRFNFRGFKPLFQDC